MLFATFAVVCTMSYCNDYGADLSATKDDAKTNSARVQIELDKAMETEEGLNAFLKKYQIGETVFEIVSIDIETHEIPEDGLP